MPTDAVLDHPSLAAGSPVTVSVASEADGAAWDGFVADHSDATGYHLWAWRQVFHGTFRHECTYLMAKQGADVVGVLPLVYINSRVFGRTMTSLPFVNYGGVVANSPAIAGALLEEAVKAARVRRCAHLELRHTVRRYPSLPCRQHKVTMLLQLEPGMWERLDRKVRNQIRKAQKSDLTAEVGGRELRADFYTVFSRNMRDLGTPVYSPRLFDDVLDALPGRTALHVVRLNGNPIAAGLRFRHRNTVEVPWASSIRDYNNLCPNHLLYWSVIEAAVAEGCGILDFGRSTPNEGTYRFKEQWGAQAVPLHWEYGLSDGGGVPNLGPTNPKYQLAIEAWKKLPLSIATTIGPHIVRSIP